MTSGQRKSEKNVKGVMCRHTAESSRAIVKDSLRWDSKTKKVFSKTRLRPWTQDIGPYDIVHTKAMYFSYKANMVRMGDA